MLLLQRCALRKFQVTDGQNTRDQITSDRRSKHAWSKCFLSIPYVLSGSPNECWLHTCDTCVIRTWRLGLRVPLVAPKNHRWIAFFAHPDWLLKLGMSSAIHLRATPNSRKLRAKWLPGCYLNKRGTVTYNRRSCYRKTRRRRGNSVWKFLQVKFSFLT